MHIGIGRILTSAPSGELSERNAAQQFEALLIAQMLRSAREGNGAGEASDTLTEFAEQKLAESLSVSGGLGLARLIEDGLGRPLNRKDSAGPAPGHQSQKP
jgi:Rod binding domain-containing protein